MRTALSFVPVLLIFGPLFMVQGLRGDSLSQYLIALSGALALAVGLSLVFRRLSHQQQRIVDFSEVWTANDLPPIMAELEASGVQEGSSSTTCRSAPSR